MNLDAALIIDGALIAMGGRNESGYTDKLKERDVVFSRKHHKIYRRWIEELPPMRTARFLAAVVTTSDKEHVLVIGGDDIDYWTTTVELYFM